MKPLESFGGQRALFSWPNERHSLVEFDGPAGVLAIQDASTAWYVAPSARPIPVDTSSG